MAEQIMCLCWCDPVRWSGSADHIWASGYCWTNRAVGYNCPDCDQPVRAVNITALEAKLARVEALVGKWGGDACTSPDDYEAGGIFHCQRDLEKALRWEEGSL